MLEALGKTQQTLLKTLLATRAGLSIDRLAGFLNITRTAVRQHINALESFGYIEKAHAVSTGGRPGQFYRLTDKGHGLFPKQYSLFSDILLRAILAEKGEDGLGQWLDALGRDIARTFAGKTAGKTTDDRIVETIAIMNTLAYDARLVEPEEAGSLPAIEAANCVYHELAAEHRQVCQFDLALIAGLSGTEVIHEKCIQQGDNVCRFCFRKAV